MNASQVQSGRKAQYNGNASKTMLTLLDDQIVWLDQLSVDIRYNTKGIVDRGAIVRALIAAIKDSGIDLAHSESETGIRKIITESLDKNRALQKQPEIE